MTIAATYSKLVSLTAGTSGITTAPEALPIALPEDGLPFAITRVGGASWNVHAEGLYRQVRHYDIDVFVQLIAEGLEPDEGYKKCLTPLYNLGRTFVANWSLDNTVDQIGSGSKPTFSDTGVQIIEFAGRRYYGFTVSLDITEKAS